jgi:hypothetical protein
MLKRLSNHRPDLLRPRTKLSPDFDGSAVQFVRVPTTRAIGLIFLLQGDPNQRSNIQVQLGILNIYEYLCDAQSKNTTDEAVVIAHAVLAINTVRGRGSRRSPLAGGADGADGCHGAG